MPYKIEKSDEGWFVINKDTGERKNKKPHASKDKAHEHMRALYAATANESYDTAVAAYLLEYAAMINANPLGATTTSKMQIGSAGAPKPQQPAVNLNDPKHQELAYEMLKNPNDPAWADLSTQQKKQLVDDYKKRLEKSRQANTVASTVPPSINTPVSPSSVSTI